MNATNRLPLRSRAPQRVKDENAKHLRKPSADVARQAGKDFSVGVKAVVGAARTALGEVTAVNQARKNISSAKVGGKEKPVVPTTDTLKRNRSASVAATAAPQRVAAGPARVAVVPKPESRPVVRPSSAANRPVARLPLRAAKAIVPHVDEAEDEQEQEPEAAEDVAAEVASDEPEVVEVAREVEEEEEEELEEEEEELEPELEEDLAHTGRKRTWPELSSARAKRCKREVEAVRETFEDEQDTLDPTMVSEYAEDIFTYMEKLEEDTLPRSEYISQQTEITWDMRETLVDWLLQVHLRYHMLPETLWITINIIDRFLSTRVVSLVKLQLVGVTAMFIAAKYEEILAPSVDEFVFLTENGYTREEILKGENIILQVLDFKISQYCSPYSWMRKISKADDYDIQTRTLCKFLTEVTLLDHRFLSVKPSLVAAVGMYCARRMLGGDWNDAFVFHSGFAEEEVLPGHRLLVDKLSDDGMIKTSVFKKYAHKKFLKASVFAVDWARSNYEAEVTNAPESDGLEPSVPPSDGLE